MPCKKLKSMLRVITRRKWLSTTPSISSTETQKFTRTPKENGSKMLVQLLRLTSVILKLILTHLVLVLSSKDLSLLSIKSPLRNLTHWWIELKDSSRNFLGLMILRRTFSPNLILLILILLLLLALAHQSVSISLIMTISDKPEVLRTLTLAMYTQNLRLQTFSSCTKEILILWSSIQKSLSL